MTGVVEEIRGLFSFQLFDPAFCDRVIKYADKSDQWSAASIGEERNGNYSSAVRPQYRSAVTFSPPQESPVQRELAQRVDRLVCPDLEKSWHVDHLRQADTHIVRYVPGGFYVTHADAGLDLND